MTSPTILSDLPSSVSRHGYALIHDVLDRGTIRHLIDALNGAVRRESSDHRGRVPGMRNLLEAVPEVARLARDPRVRGIAESVLGPDCAAVRGILFDKMPEANWKVAWHQDLTIGVKKRVEVAGFGPWSVKAGVDSVQPPTDVLERMITIRLHLDDCREDNGPLRVIPGSHGFGRLDAPAIAEWRSRGPVISTAVPAGAALVMRPLLLHASSPAASPHHRRVVHLDFAGCALPGGLEWHVAV